MKQADTRSLEKEIQQEQSLSTSMPELFTVIRVIPERCEMVEDEEIERIGMEIAMEYEGPHGRVPEDVTKRILVLTFAQKVKMR
ncbi:MAG: hypothetical protein Q6352_017075 [Candidatus Freyrarchaeum guaymaensis]